MLQHAEEISRPISCVCVCACALRAPSHNSAVGRCNRSQGAKQSGACGSGESGINGGGSGRRGN